MVSMGAGGAAGTGTPPTSTPDAAPDGIAITYPDLYVAADATAQSAQHGYLRLARVDLLLLIGGALLTTVAVYAPPGLKTWTFVAAAALLGATTIVKSANKMRGADRTWLDGRAAAQSILAATWHYMMRVPPFDGEDAAANARFIASLGDTLDAHPTLRPVPAESPDTAEEITAGMRRVRALPLAARRHCYVDHRLDEQIAWYAAKAERSRRAADRWFWVDVAARAIALGCAVAVIVLPQNRPSLAALFTAVAAAATAWSQLSRDEELAKSYGLTAQRLLLLKASLDNDAGAGDEEGFRRIVAAAEAAIARETTAWLSKRS